MMIGIDLIYNVKLKSITMAIILSVLIMFRIQGIKSAFCEF